MSEHWELRTVPGPLTNKLRGVKLRDSVTDLLMQGWEPFAVSVTGLNESLWLRRRTVSE